VTKPERDKYWAELVRGGIGEMIETTDQKGEIVDEVKRLWYEDDAVEF
jgi:hypothetical protein